MKHVESVPQFQAIGTTIATHWLQVPAYQRSYAWDEDHVVALFEDFSNAIATDDQYFLGSIIMTPAEEGRLEVIDGQQRLATTSILIAAIRDYIFANENPERAKVIQGDYLMSKDAFTLKVNPRLRLNRDDNDFFTNSILLSPDDAGRKIKPTKRSHRKMAAASEQARIFVHKVVSAFRESDRPARLMQWVKFLTTEACVICFTVPDHANAYTLFETLNDRGLELSQADLVKNYIFSCVSKERLDDAQQNWAEMLGALELVGGRDMTTTFIRHHWISRHGHARDRGLYKKIKQGVKGDELAFAFSKDLTESAPMYAALLSAQHPYWKPYGEDTREYIDALKSLGIERLRPLLLAVLRAFELKEAKKTIKTMVSWSVRFLIAGGPAGTVEEHLNLSAHEVAKGTITDTKSLVKSLGKIIPTDKEFQAKFETATASKVGLIQYYLRALENSFDSAECEPAKVVNLRSDVVSIEHILPEKPGPEWHLDPETIDAYCYRLGNLALMRNRPNSLASNSGFAKKVEFYKNENALVMTKALTGYPEWGPAQIEERQKEMAKRAVKVWRI